MGFISEICEDNIQNQKIFHQSMSSVSKRKCDWCLPVQKLCSCKCDRTFGMLWMVAKVLLGCFFLSGAGVIIVN